MSSTDVRSTLGPSRSSIRRCKTPSWKLTSKYVSKKLNALPKCRKPLGVGADLEMKLEDIILGLSVEFFLRHSN